MAIVINGSGTVTGLAVGGLPDGIVDAGTLATNSVDSAELIDGAVDDSHMASIKGRKNLIINGKMKVAQRGSVATAASGYNTIDRFKFTNSTDGAYTSEQSSEAPDGFGSSVKLDVTTADTSISAAQYATFRQAIEGQNVQHLKWGTADAQDITVSFWVRSSKTGTYTIAIQKTPATEYYYTSEYSISSADTWEKKTITIPALTNASSNSAFANTSNGGLILFFGLSYGANHTAGATNNTWNTAGDIGLASQVNWLDSTSNDFYITGIQLELGSTATNFEQRHRGEELALCQRYYINRKINAVGAEYGSYDNLIWMYQYDMRASPSFSIPSGNISDDFVGGTFSYTPTGNYIDSEGLRISYYLGSTSILGGRSYSADVVFDAEL